MTAEIGNFDIAHPGPKVMDERIAARSSEIGRRQSGVLSEGKPVTIRPDEAVRARVDAFKTVVKALRR